MIGLQLLRLSSQHCFGPNPLALKCLTTSMRSPTCNASVFGTLGHRAGPVLLHLWECWMDFIPKLKEEAPSSLTHLGAN